MAVWYEIRAVYGSSVAQSLLPLVMEMSEKGGAEGSTGMKYSFDAMVTALLSLLSACRGRSAEGYM